MASLIQLQKGLPAPVTSLMAIQHLRELGYERIGLQKLPTAATFAQKSVSPMDQLLIFSKVIAWLLSQIGGNLQEFNEFDEPNAIAMEILNSCKQFVACGDMAPHELRQGSGDSVCMLLLATTEAVLQRKKL